MAQVRLLSLLFGLGALAAGVTACDDKASTETAAKGSASAASSAPAPPADFALPGVDASTLTPRERRDWAAQVSELLAPCPNTPVTIAACVKEKRDCKTCLPAAQLLIAQVQAGRSKKDREDAFHARFDADKVKNVPVDDSPSVGPDGAIETLVEWADFECPHCRLMTPILDDVVRRFPEQVRLVFRYYPLQIHAHGEIAARAAVAAANQGKFWEMHHALFENQDHLEQTELESYARALKLDATKWKTDFVSKAAAEKIDRDKKAADELGLDGTPFLFANGRYVDLHLLVDPYKDLIDWVKLDIELAGKTPKMLDAPPPPAPSGSAAAGPSPSASASASAAPATPPPPKK